MRHPIPGVIGLLFILAGAGALAIALNQVVVNPFTEPFLFIACLCALALSIPFTAYSGFWLLGNWRVGGVSYMSAIVAYALLTQSTTGTAAWALVGLFLFLDGGVTTAGAFFPQTKPHDHEGTGCPL